MEQGRGGLAALATPAMEQGRGGLAALAMPAIRWHGARREVGRDAGPLSVAGSGLAGKEGRLQGCLARAPPAAAPAREERWLAPGLGSPALRLTPAPYSAWRPWGRGRAGRGAGAPPAGRRAPSRGIGGGSSGARDGGGAESSTRAAVPVGGIWVGGWGRERWGEVGPTTDEGEI
jgi:hypothetical protein